MGSLLLALVLGFADPAPDELNDRVRSAIDRGIGFLRDRQLIDGSWAGWAVEYQAGITILEICARRLGTRLGPTKRRQIRRRQEAALGWLASDFTMTRNPPNRSWHYFHLWGYERVGALLGVEKIGTHDWYRKGAEFLLKNQKKPGNWYSPPDPTKYDRITERMAELRTCLAPCCS